MSKAWQWFLPGYFLALPGTIVGLFLLVWYGASKTMIKQGVINIVINRPTLIGGKWVGAQTYGNIVFYRDEAQMARADLRTHESKHVWQAMIFTWPLMSSAYAIQYLWRRFVRGFDHFEAYNGLFWERHARHDQKNVRSNEWGA